MPHFCKVPAYGNVDENNNSLSFPVLPILAMHQHKSMDHPLKIHKAECLVAANCYLQSAPYII